jgi:hypothetical protein
MKYISVSEAVAMLGVTPQAVYQAIRRRTLKAKRSNGKIVTSYEWIHEYLKYWRSKQEHSMFNGEKVFNKDKGEYSIIMAAKELGVKPQLLQDMHFEGKIKTYYKGKYIVISKKELERVKESVLERHRKSA